MQAIGVLKRGRKSYGGIAMSRPTRQYNCHAIAVQVYDKTITSFLHIVRAHICRHQDIHIQFLRSGLCTPLRGKLMIFYI
jgi:hypothetical protein